MLYFARILEKPTITMILQYGDPSYFPFADIPTVGGSVIGAADLKTRRSLCLPMPGRDNCLPLNLQPSASLHSCYRQSTIDTNVRGYG